MALSFFVMTALVRGRKSDPETVISGNGRAYSKDYPFGFFFNVS